MDFTPTEAQLDLEKLTRSIVAKLVTNERLRELDTAAERFDEPLWQALIDAGVLSAAVPESIGGGGFGMLEQATVLRELGRGPAAVPFLSSIVQAATALTEFGTAAQQDWARKAASGDAILSVALTEENNDDPRRPVTTAQPTDSGWTIDGAKFAVPFARRADRILVPASTRDGVAVFLVDPNDDGVRITPQRVVDFSAEDLVEFTSVSADLVGDVEVVDWLETRGALGLAATQLGVLEKALESVADYARERVQFDRPIGSFQAVAQRLADAYIDVKGVRLTVTQAAWQLAAGQPADDAVRTAKFWAADAGHRVAHTVVHVHGGVGLDTDHPVHRYFLAAKHNEFALGSATDHLRRLGASLART